MSWWANVDGAGHTLNGQHDYRLHFPPGGLPPNHAFWSLTMGDAHNRWVANPLNRYSGSDRSDFWPRMLLSVFKRAILVQGFGDGPILVNTLGTEPPTLFADPLHPPASASKLATTGVNRDTLLTVGW